MTSKKTFAGIPQVGDGDHRTARSTVEQRPASELKDSIFRLFELEHIVGLKWRQYIPYFNDGDTCEFTVGEIYISDSRAPEEAGGSEEDADGLLWFDDYSYSDTVWFETGEMRENYRGEMEPAKDLKYIPHSWSDQETVNRVNEVMNMIGPAFYDALETSFGSYAEVTFKKVDGELKVFVESCEPPH